MERKIQECYLLQKVVTGKYLHGYLVKSNSPILSGVVLACSGFFLFILPRSYLFLLVAVGSGFFRIFLKGIKVGKARKKMKARKAVNKIRACKALKKLKVI